MVDTPRPQPAVTPTGSDGAKLSARSTKVSQRIVLLAPELFKAEGGIARISRLYLQAIADNAPNAHLSVVVLNDATIPASALARYHAPNAEAVGCNRSKWHCAKALWHATRAPKTTVVCTHIHLAPLLWAIRLMRPTLNYDIVVHGIEVWTPLSWLSRRSIAKARHVLSVSEYTRQKVNEQVPDQADKLIVLPNALDPGFEFEVASDARVPYILLTVSRLASHDQEKGIDHLIEAMEQIVTHQPQAQLRTVGEGVDRARLEAIAHHSPAKAHITFLGFVPEAQLKQEFQRCAVFALPSKKEGFGLVYLEAMAAGKPCIAANAGGAPEVINEESGIIVPYGDPKAIAQAVLSAMDRSWDLAALRAQVASFSYSAFSARWKDLCLRAS